jgi:hypothetical protein
MISVLQGHNTINLSREMFHVSVLTDAFLISYGSRAMLKIWFQQVVSTPSDIHLVFSDEFGMFNCHIKFRNTVSDPLTDIPITGTNAPSTVAQVRTAVVNILHHHPRIMNVFDYFIDGNDIVFLAKNDFSQIYYDTNQPSFGQWSYYSHNPASSPHETRADFRLIAKLSVFHPTNQNASLVVDTQFLVPQLRLNPLSNNPEAFAEIDFKEVASLQHQPELPVIDNTNVHFLHQILKKCAISVAEWFDNNIGHAVAVRDIFILDAKIRYGGFDEYSNHTQNIIGYWLCRPKYPEKLTNANYFDLIYEDTLTKNQPYWLSVIVPANLNIRIIATPVEYDDIPSGQGGFSGGFSGGFQTGGSGIDSVILADIPAAPHIRTIRIPCGTSHLNWNFDHVYSYGIVVAFQFGFFGYLPASFVHYLNVDHRFTSEEKFFLYKNALGAYQVLRACGLFTYKLKE